MTSNFKTIHFKPTQKNSQQKAHFTETLPNNHMAIQTVGRKKQPFH
jgi:hypothetical protein